MSNRVDIRWISLKFAEFCRILSGGRISRTMPPNRGLVTARTRLAELRDKAPASMAARIRALWPEIKAALERGHSLKAVCDCLEADGLALSVQALGSYISRIRRE